MQVLVNGKSAEQGNWQKHSDDFYNVPQSCVKVGREDRIVSWVDDGNHGVRREKHELHKRHSSKHEPARSYRDHVSFQDLDADDELVDPEGWRGVHGRLFGYDACSQTIGRKRFSESKCIAQSVRHISDTVVMALGLDESSVHVRDVAIGLNVGQVNWNKDGLAARHTISLEETLEHHMHVFTDRICIGIPKANALSKDLAETIRRAGEGNATAIAEVGHNHCRPGNICHANGGGNIKAVTREEDGWREEQEVGIFGLSERFFDLQSENGAN